jgi:hypothetical protein
MGDYMVQVILGFFGYAKIPLEAVQLIEKVIYDISRPNPPTNQIKDALIALKNMLRSARKLGK